MGTVINPQRDLIQDVGPEVSVHVSAHTWCYVCLTCVCYVYSYRTQPKYNTLNWHSLPAYALETGQQPERSVPTGRTMKWQWGCRVTFGSAPHAYGP